MIYQIIPSKWEYVLIHNQLEIHGCILSTGATNAQVITHKAINIHSADQRSIVLDQFQMNMYI